MTFRKYEKYSLEDFLADDFFIQWITKREPRDNSFWQSFVEQHPGQKEIIMEAASIIRAYRRQDTFDNEAHREEVWSRINASIDNAASVKKVYRLRLYTRIAASIILLVSCSFVIWMLTQSDFEVITTAYGEMKAVTLPDESIVMLNGNSVLRYRDTWSENAIREVWVKGEAYFDVRHLNQDPSRPLPHDRFIVHGNGIDISVLGTSFNVRSRRDKTNIVLISGKIEVSYIDSVSLSPAGLVMMPGDYVEYAGRKLVTRKRLERPHKVATWAMGEITFISPSLDEIIEVLQDNYGYTIHVEDPALMQLRIEGEINVANVGELLELVSSTLHVRIEEKGKNINVARK